MSKLYKKLAALSRKAALYESVESLLHWDQETYMPSAANPQRAEQSELIASMVHKEKTSKSFTKCLGQLIDLDSGHVLDSSLSAPQAGALRMWRREYLQLARLPSAFVKKSASTASHAIHAWAQAKKENKFALFAPHLDKVVTLARKKAELLGYKNHPYDALLDLYEPGMTTVSLEKLFTTLKMGLLELFRSVRAQPSLDESFLSSTFPVEKQVQFCKLLMEKLGLPNNKTRLDFSNHPFCTGNHPCDIRITIRAAEDSFSLAPFATLHEAGHALYQLGLPEEHFGTPMGSPCSLGIHESQSRWWEAFIGQSYPFWEHCYPLLQELFPKELTDITLEGFYRGINVVKPHFIRIESDEVTYSLHIILRFELEKALIEGSLKTKEVPEAWNHKMRELLGVTPPTDTLGCLQDIHWSMGGMGYFPTYTLGNLYAAQLFDCFTRQFPDWNEAVTAGRLAFITEWLHEKIHRHGNTLIPTDLIRKATGEELSERHFLTYLRKKYSLLYALPYSG